VWGSQETPGTPTTLSTDQASLTATSPQGSALNRPSPSWGQGYANSREAHLGTDGKKDTKAVST